MAKKLIQQIRGLFGGPNATGSTHLLDLPRGIKLVLYTIRGVNRHQTMVRSAALSFYTIMSLVPILALVFAVFKGFGLDLGFMSEMYNRFPEYNQLLDMLFGFAENMLARTRGGVVAAGSIMFLLWAVYQVFGGVESAFNAIWEVKRVRSLARSITDYIAIIFIVPVFLLLLNGILGEAENAASRMTAAWIVETVHWFIVLLGLWGGILLLYHQLPNTKVHFRPAALAALAAAIVLLLFVEGYLFIQRSLNTYNAIYGTFAAIPLMLGVVQASWMILLLGGELSYAIQNVQNFELDEESQHIGIDTRQRIAVAIMAVIAKRYATTASSAEEIASELGLPNRIITAGIFDLENAGLVRAAASSEDEKTISYLPALDVHSLTIADVTCRLDHYEANSISLEGNTLLVSIGEKFDRFESIIKGSAINVRIIDLL